MKHLGDITKIDWRLVPPVDVVTGGSPCQDLSIAGKRSGLSGERSGLFAEQIRCVRELREEDAARGRTNDMVRPRFVVWENVLGAFSSNKGEDFRVVLEEFVKLAEPDVTIPGPPKGKWQKWGCIVGDGWSCAWRTHDAQYWGVAQRRRRISVVVDLGGRTAPEILFEREGLSGNTEPGGETREETAGAVGSDVEGASWALTPWDSQTARVYTDSGVWHSLNANSNGGQSRDSVFVLQGNGIDRADTAGCNGKGWREDVSYTLNTIDRPAVLSVHQNASGEVHTSSVGYTVGTSSNASGRNTPLCYDARGNGDGQTVCTLTGDHQNSVTDYTALTFATQSYSEIKKSEIGASVRASGGAYGGGIENYSMLNNIVRRLTPLECERLQGYPDGWTDIGDWTDSKGKKHKASDSPRYKALGNSIALPFWYWLLERISKEYDRSATLGSLFDGIGGFPLCWECIQGKGTALWASEIEEFPMAVTKKRFGDD